MPRKYALCVGRGQIVAQSRESKELLIQSPAFRILNWFGMVDNADSMAKSAKTPSIFSGETRQLVHIRDAAEAKTVEFFHGVSSEGLEPVQLATEGGIAVTMFALPQEPSNPTPGTTGPRSGGVGGSGRRSW